MHAITASKLYELRAGRSCTVCCEVKKPDQFGRTERGYLRATCKACEKDPRRYCVRCGENKAIDEFSTRKNGPVSVCLACHRRRRKERRAEFKEEQRMIEEYSMANFLKQYPGWPDSHEPADSGGQADEA